MFSKTFCSLQKIIRLGDRAAITKTFSQDAVVNFANLIGDHNPIHLEAAVARKAGFPDCIVHGMLVASLFSGLMGMDLPGPHSVYLQQKLEFIKPVFVGEEVTAKCEVREFNAAKGLVLLDTTVSKRGPDDTEIICIRGSALGMNKVVAFDGESPWTFKR